MQELLQQLFAHADASIGDMMHHGAAASGAICSAWLHPCCCPPVVTSGPPFPFLVWFSCGGHHAWPSVIAVHDDLLGRRGCCHR